MPILSLAHVATTSHVVLLCHTRPQITPRNACPICPIPPNFPYQSDQCSPLLHHLPCPRSLLLSHFSQLTRLVTPISISPTETPRKRTHSRSAGIKTPARRRIRAHAGEMRWVLVGGKVRGVELRRCRRGLLLAVVGGHCCGVVICRALCSSGWRAVRLFVWLKMNVGGCWCLVVFGFFEWLGE